jgi:hypothetical protein
MDIKKGEKFVLHLEKLKETITGGGKIEDSPWVKDCMNQQKRNGGFLVALDDSFLDLVWAECCEDNTSQKYKYSFNLDWISRYREDDPSKEEVAKDGESGLIDRALDVGIDVCWKAFEILRKLERKRLNTKLSKR